MRRSSARLAQLRAHLERVHWRDKQACALYDTLLLAQNPISSASLTSFDAVLKDYYNNDFIRQSCETNAFLAFTKKKLAQSTYRVEPLGLEAWLPVKASYEDIGRAHDQYNIEKYGTALPAPDQKQTVVGPVPWTCGDCGATGKGGYHSCGGQNRVWNFEHVEWPYLGQWVHPVDEDGKIKPEKK